MRFERRLRRVERLADDGSATFATARFRLATAATRISEIRTRPARAGAVEASGASPLRGPATQVRRPPRCQDSRKLLRPAVRCRPLFTRVAEPQPDGAMRPSGRTTTSSTSSSPSGRWVIRSTVRPSAAESMSPTTRSAVSGSRCAVGSSRTRTGASARSARASAIRWRWPPESSLPSSPTSVSRPSGSEATHVPERARRSASSISARSRRAARAGRSRGWSSRRGARPGPRPRSPGGRLPGGTRAGRGPRASRGPPRGRGSGGGG